MKRSPLQDVTQVAAGRLAGCQYQWLAIGVVVSLATLACARTQMEEQSASASGQAGASGGFGGITAGTQNLGGSSEGGTGGAGESGRGGIGGVKNTGGGAIGGSGIAASGGRNSGGGLAGAGGRGVGGTTGSGGATLGGSFGGSGTGGVSGGASAGRGGRGDGGVLGGTLGTGPTGGQGLGGSDATSGGGSSGASSLGGGGGIDGTGGPGGGGTTSGGGSGGTSSLGGGGAIGGTGGVGVGGAGGPGGGGTTSGGSSGGTSSLGGGGAIGGTGGVGVGGAGGLGGGGTTSGGASGGQAVCGNGVVEPGEQCDLGAANADRPAFVVTQDNLVFAVAPYAEVASSTNFYDYVSASGHTGLEKLDTSLILLYLDRTATALSLIVEHGVDASTTSEQQPASRVQMLFSGLPVGSAVAVSDDPGELVMTSATTAAGKWSFKGNTDGGVLTGFPIPGSWEVLVSPAFLSGITSWTWIQGSSSVVNLDLTVPIDIKAYATPSLCRTDCTIPRCGDGILDGGEVCDDGINNGVAGDACSSDCLLAQ
ncbi:MAG: hypothetical protein ABSF35_20220 [Polyangia bacterium]